MANVNFVATLPPRWIHQFPLAPFEVNGDPILLFDFTLFDDYTAIGLALVNLGEGALHVTPEVSADGIHPAAGAGIPAAWDLSPGFSYVDKFGIDLGLDPYWRLWVSGITSGQWGLRGLARR